MKAVDFQKLLRVWADVMAENRTYLIDLDSVVGDGDLGLTMGDGFKAAADAAEAATEEDIGKLAYFAGKTMSTAVPSTMGTLMASGFMNAGKTLKGLTELKDADIAAFFQAFLEGVQNRGKAALGEKTFLDGLAPAVESLKQDVANGVPTDQAAQNAAEKAHQAFLNTKGMLARHGRAATRGEASRELLDPGAAVAELMMKGYATFTAYPNP